ncbi:MAG: hypothetical protein KDN22_03010 [Verrucomicrobiae bacterium]|nr:hypothetical protein [Verrucomicrobiae bacterium]
MKTGDEEQAFSVLNRKSFKETISLSPEISPKASPQQQFAKGASNAEVDSEQKTTAAISDSMEGFENLDLSAMKKPSELPKPKGTSLTR